MMLAALSGARATAKAGGFCGDRIISAAHVCCVFFAPSLNSPAVAGATGFSAIGRLWHRRAVESLKAFHSQPVCHRFRYRELLVGRQETPTWRGARVRNLPFMISFALSLIPPSALPYWAPLDLLFRSLHTCSASVFSPPGPRPL